MPSGGCSLFDTRCMYIYETDKTETSGLGCSQSEFPNGRKPVQETQEVL